MFERYFVRGIYRLLNPLQGLIAAIASINNDVFIATVEEIVSCEDNR